MMDQYGHPVKMLPDKFVPVPFALIESMSQIGSLAVCVYLAIAKHADKNNEAFPSQATIAKICGVTDRAVRNALKTLKKAGFLNWENDRTESRRHASNLYSLLIESSPLEAERSFRAESSFLGTRNVASGAGRNVGSGGTRNVGSAELEPLGTKTRENQNQENQHAARVSPKAPRKRSRGFSPDDFDKLTWPESLDTDRGREAFCLWLQYKAERSQAYKGSSGPQALLNKFGNGSDDDFRAAVHHSIACNYAGCFSPNGKDSHGNGHHRQIHDDPRGNIATVQRYIDEIGA